MQFAINASKWRSRIRKTIVPSGYSLVESFQTLKKNTAAKVEQVKAKIDALGKSVDKLRLQKLLHERIIHENELQKVEGNLLTSESVGRQLSKFNK